MVLYHSHAYVYTRKLKVLNIIIIIIIASFVYVKIVYNNNNSNNNNKYHMIFRLLSYQTSFILKKFNILVHIFTHTNRRSLK